MKLRNDNKKEQLKKEKVHYSLCLFLCSILPSFTLFIQTLFLIALGKFIPGLPDNLTSLIIPPLNKEVGSINLKQEYKGENGI